MKTTIRFFIHGFCEDTQGYTTKEVDELSFVLDDGRIDYSKDSVSEHGVAQVCLTKTDHY